MFLGQTREYAYCAFYDLDLPEIISLLDELSATKDIRLYMDDEYHIPRNYSREDSSAKLMHNKYCVSDDARIFTGSFNPTSNDAYKNDNNAIAIESKLLAENYRRNFIAIWEGRPGEGNAVHPKIIYNNISIENYFCPIDECEMQIKREIGSAGSSVYFMAFSFTSQGIANSLAMQKLNGIEIKGVMEKKNAGNQSSYPFL